MNVYADLRVTRTEQNSGTRRAVVLEIKTFERDSAVHELEEALGQYLLYRTLLQQVVPEDEIYLAVSEDIYKDLFVRKSFQLVVQIHQIAMVVLDITNEEIVQWIP